MANHKDEESIFEQGIRNDLLYELSKDPETGKADLEKALLMLSATDRDYFEEAIDLRNYFALREMGEKEERYGWRNRCEDGSGGDVDPEDYETEDEYNEALKEKKEEALDDEVFDISSFRTHKKMTIAEASEEYYIFPEDYDSREEFLEALNEARYGWREYCEDSGEWDVDPEDYETEDEYNEALEEKRKEALLDEKADEHITGTRKKMTIAEASEEYYIFPEDYDSREEFLEALNEARYGWRDYCEDGEDWCIDPEDYETEEDYETALEEAKENWEDSCEDGSLYDLYPWSFNNPREYNEELMSAKSDWRFTRIDVDDYDLDPYDFETEEDFDRAIKKWR